MQVVYFDLRLKVYSTCSRTTHNTGNSIIWWAKYTLCLPRMLTLYLLYLVCTAGTCTPYQTFLPSLCVVYTCWLSKLVHPPLHDAHVVQDVELTVCLQTSLTKPLKYKREIQHSTLTSWFVTFGYRYKYTTRCYSCQTDSSIRCICTSVRREQMLILH